MRPVDRLVNLLNVDAEIAQIRGWLADPRTMPIPLRADKPRLGAELAWLESCRERLFLALNDAGGFPTTDGTRAPRPFLRPRPR
ncbi:hypothetical protein LMG24235_06635 [Paraburkholderia sabiae]|nr:hypothetical protein LMG24235_06635 [Paraburkholderia sabiae]